MAFKVLMEGFAGIFFKMGPGNADHLLFTIDHDGGFPGADYWKIKLADLVTLGKVRIEIVLPRKDRARRYRSADGKAKLHRHLHGLLIKDRKNPG